MEKRIRAISERRYYSKWILIPLVIVVFAAMGITCSAGLASFAKAEKITDQTEAEKRADLNEGKSCWLLTGDWKDRQRIHWIG